MTQDEIAVMDGGKCILQLRGVRPFFSDKYDITQHPNYKYLSDYDKKNAFDINDIQSVNITYPSVTDDVKEISSREDIELALKLTGFLKYDLFGEVNSEEEPAITITYFLKDGTSKTISANNTTVWWNNKIHVIKDKEMFINLTEGIFFLEDLQTK